MDGNVSLSRAKMEIKISKNLSKGPATKTMKLSLLTVFKTNFTALKSTIVIVGDKRKKPDKFTRIETTLEPLNTKGKLFLNEEEKGNVNMQTVEEQFKAIEQGSKTHDDAPDAAEGAKHIIDTKFYVDQPMVFGMRKSHSKRF